MYQIKELNTFSEMAEHYELIRQLNPWLSQEKYEARLQAMIPLGNYCMLAVYDEQRCVGISGIWIATKIYSGKYIEMDNVVVDEAYRSKGIGKLLVDATLALAKKEGCRIAMLDAYIPNSAAHKFYERHGFEAKGYHFIKKID